MVDDGGDDEHGFRGERGAAETTSGGRPVAAFLVDLDFERSKPKQLRAHLVGRGRSPGDQEPENRVFRHIG